MFTTNLIFEPTSLKIRNSEPFIRTQRPEHAASSDKGKAAVVFGPRLRTKPIAQSRASFRFEAFCGLEIVCGLVFIDEGLVLQVLIQGTASAGLGACVSLGFKGIWL